MSSEQRPPGDSDEERLRSQLRTLPVFAGTMPRLDSDAAPEQPAELFLAWLAEAIEAGVREPHAMTLATVDAAGRPSSRVLILKGLADGQWQFATSRDSRKGQELAHTPWAAANFYWPELGRQVRLRGRVLDDGPAEAARDFLARGPGSRAESLVGHQSEPLADRSELERAFAEAQAQVEADPQLVPGHWALFSLVPDEVEFWQAHVERRHTRLRYALERGRWTRTLLWP
jgi:pyridoxamine 5'-phosphate oxidase